jgi:magnesium-protoporphyrin IX monomethyl ester (oxidative) cyclase
MKVCLINPQHNIPVHLGIPPVFQPLGLLYIASELRRRHDVSIIDANAQILNVERIGNKYYSGISIDQLLFEIQIINPDIICISLLFSINEDFVLDISRRIKAQYPNKFIIIGGQAATVRAEYLIKNKDIDFIVIGEGEHTVSDLCDCICSNGNVFNIAGICYLDKLSSQIIITKQREFIQNLDSILFPARNLINMDQYFKSVESKRNVRSSYTYGNRWTSLITSRGCPFKCSFCSIHLGMGRKYRTRSPENVILEIKELYEKYRIQHINFEDDNISLNPERFEKILDMIISLDFNITWSTPNGIRADTLSKNLIKKMALSGCKRVFVAPESGVQRVVDTIIGKKQDLSKVKDVVKTLVLYGITVDASFVIGHLGETKQDILNTIMYAKELKQLGVVDMGIHIATPYYGTDLYNQALRYNLFRKGLSSDQLYTTEAVIETTEWAATELKDLQKIASWILFCHPYLKVPSILKSILYLNFKDVKQKIHYLGV